MRPFAFQSSSMVEHAAVNRVVVGSSPTSGASFRHHAAECESHLCQPSRPLRFNCGTLSGRREKFVALQTCPALSLGRTVIISELFNSFLRAKSHAVRSDNDTGGLRKKLRSFCTRREAQAGASISTDDIENRLYANDWSVWTSKEPSMTLRNVRTPANPPDALAR